MIFQRCRGSVASFLSYYQQIEQMVDFAEEIYTSRPGRRRKEVAAFNPIKILSINSSSVSMNCLGVAVKWVIN